MTPNVWSLSGINQETEFHNTIRFERADGSIIPQTPSDTVQSSMSYSMASDRITITADLSPAFAPHSDLVRQWTRQLEYQNHTLRVFDTCDVAAGVRPVFQLQVPVAPTLQPDGSIVAGRLRALPLQGVSAAIRSLPSEFTRGHRIEWVTTTGNSFAIELRWQ